MSGVVVQWCSVYCSDLDRLQTSYKLRQEFSEERGLNMPGENMVKLHLAWVTRINQISALLKNCFFASGAA